jgi:vitamin B12 transporter
MPARVRVAYGEKMRFLSSLLAIVLASSAASSNAASNVNESDAVVVTATRTTQTADESLASVSVITREDIERSQATSVSELLTGLTGIDSANTGGYGKTTSLFIRGTNSDHVLVLIDGVKIGSATLGSASFEFLPLSQIERIEVVRGPRSSLYGSEAVGGVIQIFTRKGLDKTDTHAEMGAGSYNTRAISAGMSSVKDDTGLSMTAARFKTGGFNAQKPTPGPYGVNEPDNDGYSNDSVTARLSHRFDGNTEIDAHLFRAQGHTDFDGNYQNQTNFIQQAVGTDLNFAPVNNWQVKLRAGQSQDNTDNFKDRTFVSNFDTQRDTASWQNDVTLGKNQLLTLGVDRQEDHVISSTSYTTDRRNDKGVFGQIQNKFDSQDFLLSLRQDDTDTFGKYSTGSAAWGYALSKPLRLTASYGTAFKAPTINDLYFTDIFGDHGNPNLRPEKSRNLEAGLHGKHDWGNWSVSAYQTSIDDLIIWVTDPTTFTSVPENINKARIRGLETQLSTVFAGWQSRLNFTITDPRDVGTNQILPRRSKQTLKLDADRAFGRAHFGMTWLAQGKRYEYDYTDPSNPTPIPMGGYGLLNLRAQYDLSKDWQMRAHLDNVFDKQYETAHNYNSPGRSLFVSLNYQMQ